MPGISTERYELEDVIGSGGMAEVFRAHDRLLDREVAVKVMHERYAGDPDFVERFRREARAAARLSHPNIVTVLDSGERDGRQFIVFECVEGEDLKALLEQRGRLAPRDALEIAVQLGRGLAFAHEHGVVHRDVKPQNAIVTREGLVKVTDFGIARAIGEAEITLTGTVLGTSEYLAPEQARGLSSDARGDVYSLGVLVFELLTGDVPFAAESPIAAAMRHAHEPPPSLRERCQVPARVESAVGRALEKDPSDRFQTMDDFVAELESCLASLNGRADPDQTLVIARRRRRSLLGPAVFVVTVLALGTAAAYLVRLGGDGRRSVFSHERTGSPSATAPALRAVAAYDPHGDGSEHDERLAYATDGDPSTYWETEHYSSSGFGNLKPGVGLIMDAGRPVELEELELQSDTPGFTAEIEAGGAEQGPFSPVAAPRIVEDSTSFALEVPSPRRYYVVWIARLPPGGEAHVSEVRTGA